MIAALEWLKENNEFYKDIKINKEFAFQDQTFAVRNEQDENTKPAPNEPDDHLLTLDLEIQTTTEIHKQEPAGTGLRHYILKDSKGINWCYK